MCIELAWDCRFHQGTPPLITKTVAKHRTDSPPQKSPTLLTIFSNHLLIDTVLSLVPKLGLLYLFYDLTSDLCLGSLSSNFWLPSEDSSLHGPGRVTVSSDSNDSQHWAQAMASRRHCEHGVSIARLALLAILVLWTVSQWGLGLYIRRYAVRMDLKHRLSQSVDSTFDVEKAFYEEDSLADDYQDALKSVQGWTWNGSEKEPIIEFVEKAPLKN